MANKDKLNVNTIIIIVALIIFAIVIIPKLNLKGFQFGSIVDPISLFNNEPDPECTFKVDKNIVCLGENVIGTLNAKSPTCYIGYNYNYGDWKFAGTINETSPGFYKESRAAPAIGHYEFAAICGTPADFCRTNNVEVDVILCNGDENGIEYTCGWVGEQCGGTCPTTHPLCVDMWIEDIVHGGYAFCACIDPETETVHPDWKPDGQYHDDSEGYTNGEAICTDTDPTQDVHLFGVCTPSSGIAESDFCPTDTAVTQMWCSEDETSCWGASSPCPNGEICIDGVCIVGNGEAPDEPEFDNCYEACNAIITPEYSAGKLQSDLFFHPYDCYENSKVNCEFSSSLVRWLDYTYYDLDCCCWQCEHWE